MSVTDVSTNSYKGRTLAQNQIPFLSLLSYRKNNIAGKKKLSPDTPELFLVRNEVVWNANPQKEHSLAQGSSLHVYTIGVQAQMCIRQEKKHETENTE